MLRYKYSSSNVNSKSEIGPKDIEGRDVNSKRKARIKSKSTKSSIENGFRLNSTTPCNIDQMVQSVKSGAITKNRSRGPTDNAPYIRDASRRNVSRDEHRSRKSTKMRVSLAELKCMLLNAESLANKMDEFRARVARDKPIYNWRH